MGWSGGAAGMTRFDARLAAFSREAEAISEGVGEALGDLAGLGLAGGAAYTVGSVARDLLTDREAELNRELRERSRKPGKPSGGDSELGQSPGYGVGEAKP